MQRVTFALRLFCKLAIQFACGGCIYFGIETVFRLIRRHTPPLPQVFFLGGGAFLLGILLCRIPLPRRRQLWLLPLLGFGVLTAYEYFFGSFFLTFRGLRIWNYTGCPHEYRGADLPSVFALLGRADVADPRD